MKKTISFPFLLLLALIIAVLGCETDKPSSNKAVISGDLPGYQGWLFLSKVTSNNIKMLDSADLSNGEGFLFNVNAPDYSIFRLAAKDWYPLMVVAKAGDSIKISEASDDKAWPYRVSGSDECMLLVNYLERINRDHYKVDSMSAIFQSSQSQPDFLIIRDQLDDAFIELHESHKAYARKFVTDNPSALASIVVINGFFKEFALFNQQEDFDYYQLVDKALMDRFPENQYAIDFNSQVENIRVANEYELESKMRLSPGRLLPEFELPQADGEIVNTSMLKGKNMILYFWAAADEKSRQTNEVVKMAYEAYHRYGLEVLAVSLDKDKNLWQTAIRQDELPGIHVSDLQGIRSPVQKLFNLKMQLPMYFLIDSKGRIYDHDRDFGKLQASVIELYNEDPDF